MKGRSGRENGLTVSPDQTRSTEVAQGALCGVACSYLPLYLAYCEQGGVFLKDKA